MKKKVLISLLKQVEKHLRKFQLSYIVHDEKDAQIYAEEFLSALDQLNGIINVLQIED